MDGDEERIMRGDDGKGEGNDGKGERNDGKREGNDGKGERRITLRGPL